MPQEIRTAKHIPYFKPRSRLKRIARAGFLSAVLSLGPIAAPELSTYVASAAVRARAMLLEDSYYEPKRQRSIKILGLMETNRNIQTMDNAEQVKNNLLSKGMENLNQQELDALKKAETDWQKSFEAFSKDVSSTKLTTDNQRQEMKKKFDGIIAQCQKEIAEMNANVAKHYQLSKRIEDLRATMQKNRYAYIPFIGLVSVLTLIGLARSGKGSTLQQRRLTPRGLKRRSQQIIVANTLRRLRFPRKIVEKVWPAPKYKKDLVVNVFELDETGPRDFIKSLRQAKTAKEQEELMGQFEKELSTARDRVLRGAVQRYKYFFIKGEKIVFTNNPKNR